jgi:hypothetical protein
MTMKILFQFNVCLVVVRDLKKGLIKAKNTEQDITSMLTLKTANLLGLTSKCTICIIMASTRSLILWL